MEELPRRTAAPPRANGNDPDPRVDRPAASAPPTVGGRFDRGLRRVTAERTQLLSWLAESDQAEGLRAETEIDLRREPVIDVRTDELAANAASDDDGGSQDDLSTSMHTR